MNRDEINAKVKEECREFEKVHGNKVMKIKGKWYSAKELAGVRF